MCQKLLLISFYGKNAVFFFFLMTILLEILLLIFGQHWIVLTFSSGLGSQSTSRNIHIFISQRLYDINIATAKPCQIVKWGGHQLEIPQDQLFRKKSQKAEINSLLLLSKPFHQGSAASYYNNIHIFVGQRDAFMILIQQLPSLLFIDN